MSPVQPSTTPGPSASLAQSMRDHWRVFLAEGVLLTALGLAAIFVPPLAGIVATIFLGWVFFVAGIAGLVSSFRLRGAPGFGWSLLSALAAVIAGGLLLWNPLQGLVTLTYVLIAFFIVDGVLTIVLAIAHRREMSGRWEWMMVNGVIDLILAGVIISGFPGTLVWTFGLLVGIDLMFGGAALIFMALEARKAAFK